MLFRSVVALLLLIVAASLSAASPFATADHIRQRRAINPFLDSVGKRAVNPFLDSFGKRSSSDFSAEKRYFDSLAGQSLGKRSYLALDPYGFN